jgi:hypothetical protein
MKRQGNCRMTMLWLGVVVGILVAGATAAKATIIMSEATCVDQVINNGTNTQECSFLQDGLKLYFSNDLPGGYGDRDLWVSTRETQDAPWQEPVNLGPNVNGPKAETYPAISPDELEIYFHYGISDPSLWRSTRASKDEPWGPVARFTGLGEPACDLDISADGLTVYFDSNRSGGYGDWDIWMATRETVNAPWGEAVNLGPNVNGPGTQGYPSISNDGLALFYRNGGLHGISVSTRPRKDAPWSPPVLLGPAVNGGNWQHGAEISPDGSVLYFDSGRPGGFNNENFWQVEFIPIVDFNSDGIVDIADLGILLEHWGQEEPLCDISPLPLGDGMVDEKDLKVLLKEMTGSDLVMDPRPYALDVPAGATLNWTAVPFAEAYDVYFGTTFEAVSNADRTDPCGVLVSQGQTATMYDPEGSLEFETTYYWRIDFVSAEANPTIYKGSVCRFTTEPAIYPIRNITATASSSQAGMGPEKTIDRSGLDANDLHSAAASDMWWTKAETEHWIQYEFDRVYNLHEMWVWNHNLSLEPTVGFGAKDVTVEYSTDGVAWTALDGVPEFARAPGQSGCAANTTVNFGGVPAKFVRLTVNQTWGGGLHTGLSEVRFYAISPAALGEP